VFSSYAPVTKKVVGVFVHFSCRFSVGSSPTEDTCKYLVEIFYFEQMVVLAEEVAYNTKYCRIQDPRGVQIFFSLVGVSISTLFIGCKLFRSSGTSSRRRYSCSTFKR
jgi:hypothetical protein